MTQRALPQQIGLAGALLLSFNGAVGAAIFALPATLAADTSGWAPWLFPAAGLAMLIIGIPFGWAAASMPGTGGPAIYGETFGRLTAFELGWLYYVARTAALAANLHVLVDYLLRWAGVAPAAGMKAVLLIALLVLLAVANIAGMTRALRLLGGLTLLKTLPLVALATLALSRYPLPALGPPPPLEAFEASLLLVFYAFVGFEAAAATAGETRTAERNVPRALLLTVGAIVALYSLVQLAFFAVAPEVPAGEKAPLLVLGETLLGPPGAAMILAAAVCSLGGNLHSNLATTPRITFALGERGDLPKSLAAVHARYNSPHWSIVLMAVLAGGLALSGGFVWLATVSVLARLAVYAVTIAAWLKISRPRGLALFVGFAAILLCALLATQAAATAWLTALVLAVGGALLFAVSRGVQHRLKRT